MREVIVAKAAGSRNISVSTWVPLKTYVLAVEEARKTGLNLSQYLGFLLTEDLRDSGTTIYIE